MRTIILNPRYAEPPNRTNEFAIVVEGSLALYLVSPWPQLILAKSKL
jgi:hypothetical protein